LALLLTAWVSARSGFGISAASEEASSKAGFKETSRSEWPPSADHPPIDQLSASQETWSDLDVSAALQECAELLSPLDVSYEVSKPIRNGQCGAPSPVLVRRIADVDLVPPTLMNCRVASRLHHWVTSHLQRTAAETLGTRISKIVSATGYSCRQRIGATITRQSEHSFANAFDISAFVTATGESLDVLTGWGATMRDIEKKARAPDHHNAARGDAVIATVGPANKERSQIFLRKSHEIACGIFSTVLGPEANEAHRPTFGYGAAPRRTVL
jgi:hypothetical protein